MASLSQAERRQLEAAQSCRFARWPVGPPGPSTPGVGDSLEHLGGVYVLSATRDDAPRMWNRLGATIAASRLLVEGDAAADAGAEGGDEIVAGSAAAPATPTGRSGELSQRQ